jgi:hypothetical protein
MIELEKQTYQVCADCVAFAANGPDDSMSAERVQELATAHSGVVVCPIGGDDGEMVEPSFGRGSCAVCRDSFGGYRYDCTVEMVNQ